MSSAHVECPSAPIVSLCIPTYNRARYLRTLFLLLEQDFATFPLSYEIVVSDNASTDATPQVLAEFSTRLPLRTLRQDSHVGVYPNMRAAFEHARGEYVVYLADDDFLLSPALAQLVARLRGLPEVVVAYAPWILHDVVANKSGPQFYEQPSDVLLPRNDFRGLLEHVLTGHVFPEISVIRRAAWLALKPRVNDHAFWAFVQAADYLAQGAVLFSSAPFYVSTTRYFADEQRTQVGAGEAEVGWDRYRGGLEYVLDCAARSVNTAEHAGFLLRINHFVAERLAVAVRLRCAHNRDAIDAYFLGRRVRAAGLEAQLPAPLGVLAMRAALWFLAHDADPQRGELVCDSDTPVEWVDYLRSIAGSRVRTLTAGASLDGLSDCVVLVRARALDAAAVERLAAARVLPMRDAALLSRFPV